MAELIVMVGVAGSGKSYIAHKYSYPVVSSDDIRAELYGNAEDQSHNQEVFNEVHKRINAYLKAGQSCVYDATNLSRKRRKGFLKTLPSGVRKIAHVVATELDVILEQNASRERHVPEEVIMKMYKSMTLPRMDEGWDEIRYDSNPKNKKSLEDYVNECRGIAHDSKFHKYGIFDHMKSVAEGARKIAEEKELSLCEKGFLYNAGMVHDAAKPIVKIPYLPSGKIDGYSHYPNHAEVGAYLILCAIATIDAGDFTNEMIEDYENMALLTQWHMAGFEREDFIERFSAYHGETLGEYLAIIHEADVNGH